MSHECDDCGQTFGTLTKLRLHDCSPSSSSTRADRSGGTDGSDGGAPDDGGEGPGGGEVPDTGRLAEQIETVEDGEYEQLHEAVATYETVVETAIEADGDVREIRRTYRPRLVAGLDEATRAEGWSFLEPFLEAYHPDTSEKLPQATTVLENVVGRNLVRTRLDEGVAAVPETAVDYFEAVRVTVGEYQDYLRESLHPYGWAIGHPDRPVADRIHDHATEDVFLANPFLEHAFYADQHAAIDLLERIVADDSVAVSRPGMDSTRYLLDAAAGAASDEFWPTIPRYWDWQEELDFEFEMDEEVRQRVRRIVVESGIDEDLSSEWTIPDLTV